MDRQKIIDRLNKKASSGLPYFKKKGDMLERVDLILELFRAENFEEIESFFNLPAVIFRVVQPGKSGTFKNRLIFAPPIEITILEMIYGIEITDFFLNTKDSSIVVGKTQIELYDHGMAKIYPHNKVAGDYSSFDQKMPSMFIQTSFSIIKYLLNLTPFQERIFSLVISYFMHCRIYHPITGTCFREKGIYSGSFFTSVIGSMCNVCCLHYATQDDFVEYVSGDDLILTTFKGSTLRCLSDIVSKLGMELNFSRTLPRDEYGWDFLGSK